MKAEEAAILLRDAGYMAVPANTSYTPDISTSILTVAVSVAMAIIWVFAVVFFAFFINLCFGRAFESFRGDISIMRSIGVPAHLIKTGIYSRMFISLFPAFISVIVIAILIFTTPQFNEFFSYLYFWQYALIFIGMLLLTITTTHKQMRKMFVEYARQALEGGAAG